MTMMKMSVYADAIDGEDLVGIHEIDAEGVDTVHLSMAGEASTNGKGEDGARWRCSSCKLALEDNDEPDTQRWTDFRGEETFCTDRICDACDGSGKGPWLGQFESDCPECEGHGFLAHVAEPMPLSWCNSAAIRLDEGRDTVTVTISVGDPRGAFAMRVERCMFQCSECDGSGTLYGGTELSTPCVRCKETGQIDELRLSVPAPADAFAHRELEVLASSGYFRIV